MSVKPICSLLLLLMLSFGIRAASSDDKPRLIYGVPHDPPYTILDDGGFSGRDVELVRLLADKLQADIQFTACDWIRCLEQIKAGQIDLMTSVSLVPEREAFIHYIYPAYSVEYVSFWVRKGEATQLAQYQDLRRFIVGKENGASYFPKAENDPDIEIYESTEFNTLVTMLASGRIDAIMGSDLVLERLIAKTPFADELEVAEFRKKALVSYLAMSRSSPRVAAWLPEFQQVLKGLSQSGELDYFLNWQPQ